MSPTFLFQLHQLLSLLRQAAWTLVGFALFFFIVSITKYINVVLEVFFSG